jgi:hypothetical protein
MVVGAFVLGVAGAQATTVDGRIVEVVNNGTIYTATVQLKVDVAAGLGGATLAFTFDNTNLSIPASPVDGVDYSFFAYSGGSYSTATVTRPAPNRVSVNIEYNGSTGSGTPVNTTFTDVVNITFQTLVASGSSNLTWVTTQAIADDQATPWVTGVFTGLNSNPLPIQLASFNASTLSPTQTKVTWATLSETENYGFEVQRSLSKTSGFASLAGSFVAGHGTTVDRHDYAYVDATAGSAKHYYRLKQIDMDASVHFTEPIQPSGTTDVKEQAPVVFALMQNYPNPFNPSTEIKFSVESTGRATMRLYNILGAEVSTLFDGMAEAGQYYRVRLDGSKLATGVYFYRLESEGKSDLKKMVLLK